MSDAVKRYDDARLAFLKEVKRLTEEAQQQAKKALDRPEEHDYFMYLATSFGALGQAVACHMVLTFEDWKRDYCGGFRHSRPKKALEDH